jgi:hypothetical protein
MRITAITIAALAAVLPACGTEGEAPASPKSEPISASIAAEVELPAAPLPDAILGDWSSTRYWNEGRTDGPANWSRAAIEARRVDLSDGERSKDSGQWTIGGPCGLVGGQGTAEQPYVARMKIDVSKARGRSRRVPAKGGAVLELKLWLAGDTLHVTFPRESLELRREGAAEPLRIAPHACANDDDCWTSCTYGAVNARWYQAEDRQGSECKDGCASKGMEARCEDRKCVAYRFGERVDHCTGRDVNNPRP